MKSINRTTIADGFYARTAALTCSFHRGTFTPITRSHNITDSGPRMPKARL